MPGEASSVQTEMEATWTPTPQPISPAIALSPAEIVARNAFIQYRTVSNAQGLREAIIEANVSFNTFVIFLLPNVYNFTSCMGQTTSGCSHWGAVPVLASGSNIVLRGVKSDGVTAAAAGEVVIQRGGNARFAFSFFDLHANATLTLYDLTLRQGGVFSNLTTPPRRNDGGAIMNRGTLYLYRVQFHENWVDATGGAIRNWPGGVIVMAQTTFFRNRTSRNGRGGAIYNDAGGLITVRLDVNAPCNRFQGNGTGNQRITSEGGAIFNLGDLNLKYSQFLSNRATRYGAIHNANSIAQSVTHSYWNPVYSTVSANENSSLNILNVPNAPPAAAEPPLTCVVPDPPIRPPIITPTPTSSAPTVDGIIADLATYGLTVYANGSGSLANGQAWTLTELQELQEAVQDIASAFNLLEYNDPSGVNQAARNLFKAVMQQQTTLAPLIIYRVNNNFTFTNADPCNGSRDEGCTSNGNNAIVLYGNFPLNGVVADANYTIVHEFGHRFNNQSATNGGMSLFARMDTPGTVITDCVGLRVMGTSDFDDISPNDWKRGGRGWGSHGRSIFQQNIVTKIDIDGSTDEFEEVDEATADMFLNWVYRRITDNPAIGDPCANRDQIGAWLGFRNINDTGAYDNTLPGNARYWWMETQMTQIFNSQGWS
jgi:hypothetical protein